MYTYKSTDKAIKERLELNGYTFEAHDDPGFYKTFRILANGKRVYSHNKMTRLDLIQWVNGFPAKVEAR